MFIALLLVLQLQDVLVLLLHGLLVLQQLGLKLVDLSATRALRAKQLHLVLQLAVLVPLVIQLAFQLVDLVQKHCEAAVILKMRRLSYLVNKPLKVEHALSFLEVGHVLDEVL
jgi:hypothetical protein